jgi:hypothetical protein
MDGDDRTSARFDNEVSRLGMSNIATVKSWREFYNRTKHIQKQKGHASTYYQGVKHPGEILLSIRNCIQTMMLSRLK